MAVDALEAWLCPTDEDRIRMRDADNRIGRARSIGSWSAGLALLAGLPWLGLFTLVLFVLHAGVMAVVDRRRRRSRHVGIIFLVNASCTLSAISIGAVMTGGAASPLLPWVVTPVTVLAARFPRHVVVAAFAVTVAALVGVSLSSPAALAEHPVTPLAVLALLVTVCGVTRALQEAELHHRTASVLDPLTGLFNRTSLDARFAELAEQAALHGGVVTLVVCDIDDFKGINDAHGHERGDAVLREFAERVRGVVGSFRPVYRLGGDEFLVVLPDVSVATAEQLAEVLRERVVEAPLGGLRVTLSLGVAGGAGREVALDPLFRAADEALYLAKRAGRNRVAVAGATVRPLAA